jgi:hypothetical protein
MRWAVCEILTTRFIASLLLEIKSASSSHSPMIMLTQLFRSWANIHKVGLGSWIGHLVVTQDNTSSSKHHAYCRSSQ